jgi:hypothetical protein
MAGSTFVFLIHRRRSGLAEEIHDTEGTIHGSVLLGGCFGRDEVLRVVSLKFSERGWFEGVGVVRQGRWEYLFLVR